MLRCENPFQFVWIQSARIFRRSLSSNHTSYCKLKISEFNRRYIYIDKLASIGNCVSDIFSQGNASKFLKCHLQNGNHFVQASINKTVLPKWQLSVQPVGKMASKWHFRFSELQSIIIAPLYFIEVVVTLSQWIWWVRAWKLFHQRWWARTRKQKYR